MGGFGIDMKNIGYCESIVDSTGATHFIIHFADGGEIDFTSPKSVSGAASGTITVTDGKASISWKPPTAE